SLGPKHKTRLTRRSCGCRAKRCSGHRTRCSASCCECPSSRPSTTSSSPCCSSSAPPSSLTSTLKNVGPLVLVSPMDRRAHCIFVNAPLCVCHRRVPADGHGVLGLWEFHSCGTDLAVHVRVLLRAMSPGDALDQTLPARAAVFPAVRHAARLLLPVPRLRRA